MIWSVKISLFFCVPFWWTSPTIHGSHSSERDCAIKRQQSTSIQSLDTRLTSPWWLNSAWCWPSSFREAWWRRSGSTSPGRTTAASSSSAARLRWLIWDCRTQHKHATYQVNHNSKYRHVTSGECWRARLLRDYTSNSLINNVNSLHSYNPHSITPRYERRSFYISPVNV